MGKSSINGPFSIAMWNYQKGSKAIVDHPYFSWDNGRSLSTKLVQILSLHIFLGLGEACILMIATCLSIGMHRPKMHGGRLAGLFPTLMHAETTVANNTGITKWYEMLRWIRFWLWHHHSYIYIYYIYSYMLYFTRFPKDFRGIDGFSESFPHLLTKRAPPLGGPTHGLALYRQVVSGRR
jgi:hypothetical protein